MRQWSINFGLDRNGIISGHPDQVISTKEIYFPQKGKGKGLGDKDRRYRMRVEGVGTREKEKGYLSWRDKGLSG